MMPTLDGKLRLRSSNPTPKYLSPRAVVVRPLPPMYKMNPEKYKKEIK
jgi:hypothetical protein